jgi:putative phage-type endonuclease
MLDLDKIKDLIDSHESKIYNLTKEDLSLEDLINEISSKIIEENELIQDTHFNISQKHFIKFHVSLKCEELKNKFKIAFNHKKDILQKLDKLLKLELPEQRSKEWYSLRDTMLTASSLADAVGKGHFKSRDDLLIEKSSPTPPPRFSSEITEWGVKYEPIATTFYEKINNLEVLEFGLVPHPDFKIFGASPDGICSEKSPEDYIGRMLEIKCPPKRKFTKEVPEHYWMQMQGQLECCNLEECDFLQVKIEEYSTKEEYLQDSNGALEKGKTSKDFPKGLVLSFVSYKDGETKYHYEYSEFYKSIEEIDEWSKDIISKMENYDELRYHWWRIERYECTLVLRDRQWWNSVMPEILNFWEDVEHFRSVGNQSLIDKKEEKRNKRKKNKEERDKNKKSNPKKETKPKNIITINQEISTEINNSYLLDSDSE